MIEGIWGTVIEKSWSYGKGDVWIAMKLRQVLAVEHE
jgi:hypothetical protein